MSLWDKVQAGVKKAGETAGVAAQKAKLRADMYVIYFMLCVYTRVFFVFACGMFYIVTFDVCVYTLESPLVKRKLRFWMI